MSLASVKTEAVTSDGPEGSDRRLLQRFVQERDEQAFAVLVDRYRELVMGVSWRVLRNAADAEEAFQATFLVLARRAKSLAWQEAIAGWLHQTAFRTSQKLRVMRARTRRREESVAGERRGSSEPSPDAAASLHELAQAIDEELARLPDKYREPLVLQLFSGLSRNETADRLGLEVGTVKNRLERARELLRRRLLTRGIAFSAAAVTAWLTSDAASAAVSATLPQATAKAAAAFVIGQGVSGMVPASTLSLAQGILNMMLFSKLKLVGAACVALLAFVAVAYGMIVDKPDRFDTGLRGTIESLDTTAGARKVVIKLEEFDTLLSLDISDSVKVSLAYQEGSLANLGTGAYVGLRLADDHRTVKEIHALGQTHEVVVQSVSADGNKLVASPQDSDEDTPLPSQEFALAAGALVRIGGLPARHDQLHAGLVARLELGRDGKLVNAVEAEVDEARLLNGELVEVDGPGKAIKLRIERDDADFEAWYKISDRALVILDGKPAMLSGLKPSASIAARLERDNQIIESIVAQSELVDEEDAREVAP